MITCPYNYKKNCVCVHMQGHVMVLQAMTQTYSTVPWSCEQNPQRDVPGVDFVLGTCRFIDSAPPYFLFFPFFLLTQRQQDSCTAHGVIGQHMLQFESKSPPINCSSSETLPHFPASSTHEITHQDSFLLHIQSGSFVGFMASIFKASQNIYYNMYRFLWLCVLT